MMVPQPQVMMMAPQPQVILMQNTPAKKEPKTGWHTGLYECGNDVPVCASRPSCSPLKTARPRPAPIHRPIALHGIAPPPPSRRTMPSTPLGTGLFSFCCTPCAYGMLVEMNLEDKVFQDTDSPMAVRALFLAPVPSDRVAGRCKPALRQLRRVLHGFLPAGLLPVRRLLRHLSEPRSDPYQAQPEGARPSSVWPLAFSDSPAVY
jgi:hypothetical protein